MNRNKTNYISGENIQIASKEDIAFHEAGHAAAIYINNKINKLPPVYFQITLKNINSAQQKNETLARPIDKGCVAKIDGGRLIQSFVSAADVTDEYMTAFEADIINILIGPLAEAKYIHECDNELFNPHLINIQVLNYYGGRLDLKLIGEYLQSLYPEKQEQDKKQQQLFSNAFDFVENYSNWKAISQLANYIYDSNKSIIGYQEIVSLLEPIDRQNNPAPWMSYEKEQAQNHR